MTAKAGGLLNGQSATDTGVGCAPQALHSPDGRVSAASSRHKSAIGGDRLSHVKKSHSWNPPQNRFMRGPCELKCMAVGQGKGR